ncbi:MAG: signal peptidase I [Ottowia sp.]|nr:signal peptidase I [Ottowia sp.]
MTEKTHQSQQRAMWLCLFAALMLAFFYWVKPPISIAYDPNDEQCLPDVRLALLVHGAASSIQRGDDVFWKPTGALHYIKQAFVLKRVAGIPGDHVQIEEGVVKINDAIVVSGFPLLDLKKTQVSAFARDEIIPPGYVFMIGTHPRSNDSRYWGYLKTQDIVGRGYKIF